MLCTFAGCTERTAPRGAAETVWPAESIATADMPFDPLPTELDLRPDEVDLGRRLFEDPLVSGDGDRSCADCHDLAAGGIVPGEERSNHPLTEIGPYNVPTVFNVAFNFRYNWQGAFSTLEDHLSGPMMNAKVMNVSSWGALVSRLAPRYDDDFRDAGFADGVTEENIRRALATYQRSLITPNARFDRFLRGELALDPAEARGLALFRDIGCASCHQGINVGGNMFQRFGVMADPHERPMVQLDFGRMLVTGDEADAHVFRVPSLRNVAVTAPYFHDGSALTLEDAVQRMARVQLGFTLDDEDTSDIVAFLQALTGEYQGRSLAMAGGMP